jgi:hypothetical protein
MVAAHRRDAPPRPRGGRTALGGGEEGEPKEHRLFMTSTDAPFADDVERKVSNHLAPLCNVRSFLGRACRIPVLETGFGVRGGPPPAERQTANRNDFFTSTPAASSSLLFYSQCLTNGDGARIAVALGQDLSVEPRTRRNEQREGANFLRVNSILGGDVLPLPATLGRDLGPQRVPIANLFTKI